jgi:hypothetical protein
MAAMLVCARPMQYRLLLLTMMLSLPVRASDFLPPRLYEVTIETVMPHLEENLRYTTTHEKSCIALANLSTVFPILDHPALAGCRLGAEDRAPDSVSYRLVCSGGHGTTGNALWQLGHNQIRGRLDVKLGGKNMTFSQSVTAKTLGPCP